MRRLALVAFVAAQFCAGASFAETRCGWVVNPTPGNWWLTDSKGDWIMMTQGVDRDPGLDKLPDLDGPQFVKTNGNYGYACGCMVGKFNAKEMTVVQIQSFKQRPLAVCRKDASLKPPPSDDDADK